MKRIFPVILFLFSLAVSAPQGWCKDEDQGWQTLGVRMGWMATSRNTYFHQYDAFFNYGLPWSMRNDEGWGLAMQLNGSAGALHAGGETGFIGGIGPGVIFDKAGGQGVAIDLGGDANFLSQDHFGRVDLDGHVLWDGHIGIRYRFAAGPGIGYQFQHMSNGGLNGHINTGLDLHLLVLTWSLR
jgi:hypothetical protein